MPQRDPPGFAHPHLAQRGAAYLERAQAFAVVDRLDVFAFVQRNSHLLRGGFRIPGQLPLDRQAAVLRQIIQRVIVRLVGVERALVGEIALVVALQVRIAAKERGLAGVEVELEALEHVAGIGGGEMDHAILEVGRAKVQRLAGAQAQFLADRQPVAAAVWRGQAPPVVALAVARMHHQAVAVRRPRLAAKRGHVAREVVVGTAVGILPVDLQFPQLAAAGARGLHVGLVDVAEIELAVRRVLDGTVGLLRAERIDVGHGHRPGADRVTLSRRDGRRARGGRRDGCQGQRRGR